MISKGVLFFIFTIVSSLSVAELKSDKTENTLEPISLNLQWMTGINNVLTIKQGTKKAKECIETPDLQSPICDLTRYIQKNINTSITLDKVFTSQVVFVGERHLTPQSKLLLTHNLKSLKAAGYTTLAMEMWNQSAQSFVDSFLNGLVDPGIYEHTFNQQWHYDSTYYMQLMNAAKEQGLHILAIDVRDQISKHLKYTTPQDLAVRDEQMAKNLSVFIQNNPTEKVIVFCGRLHAYTHLTEDDSQLSQIQQLKKHLDVSVQSMIVAESNDRSPFTFALHALGLKSGIVPMESNKHFTDYVLFTE